MKLRPILLFVSMLLLTCPSRAVSGETAQNPAAPDSGGVKTESVSGWGKWGGSLWPSDFVPTPGLSLFFYQPEKEVPQYALIAQGYPDGKTYDLWKNNIREKQPSELAQDLTIVKVGPADSYGYVANRADGAPILIDSTTCAKSEAVQIALVSRDRAFTAFAKIIPYPLEDTYGSYRILLELGSADGRSFIAWGEGFAPGEKVAVTSKTENHTEASTVKTDSGGRFMDRFNPPDVVGGRRVGATVYSATGGAGKVKVSCPCGALALERNLLGGSAVASAGFEDSASDDTAALLDRVRAALQGGAKQVVFFVDPAQAVLENGLVAQARGNNMGAMADYREAIRLKPEFAEAYFYLGNVYDRVGREDDALASYRDCVSAQPDFAPGYFAIGVWFGRKNDWPEAIKAYREAVRLQPESAGMQYNLGNAYLKSKRFEEAIAAYKNCLAANPGYTKGLASLGIAYIFAGRRAEAVEIQKKLQTINAAMAAQIQSLLDSNAPPPPPE